MYASLLTLTLYISRQFYYTFTFTALNVWLLNLPQHLPAITGSKPSAKPNQTGFDQLSNNYKPEPAKAAASASQFAASRTAATLCLHWGNSQKNQNEYTLSTLMKHCFQGICQAPFQILSVLQESVGDWEVLQLSVIQHWVYWTVLSNSEWGHCWVAFLVNHHLILATA